MKLKKWLKKLCCKCKNYNELLELVYSSKMFIPHPCFGCKPEFVENLLGELEVKVYGIDKMFEKPEICFSFSNWGVKK